ncbi:uncharacterized protein LOC143016838 [Genypterus blacodes]|uniref:uncharacterized protein LOC143016838 n=1 Tax=Genypterus blacodes TaxID=154954 RepID=UPI003F759014
MAPSVVGSVRAADQTAMERFGSGGMALLPWTKQMLTVLWEQLRLLVQVIYYTFVSVFQMFRFEVHVRITDETGQHINMATATNPTESFLFSSLFDGDNGVMVGGSNPLSNFCGEVGDPFPGTSTAEALLSSLRADDLCCGLVDDFVSRTGGKDDGIFLGHQSNWKMGFPGDWNIFVSSTDGPAAEKDKVFNQDISEEERSFTWSSEEDQNIVEFDSEESKALWESLSKSSDPYNPFFFSACISTNTNMGKSKSEARDSSDTDGVPVSKTDQDLLGPRGLNALVSRSDSESSWGSSDGSSADLDKEENERLWEFFSCAEDPYNPMCFTAATLSSASPHTTTTTTPHSLRPQHASLPAPSSRSDTDTEERESSVAPSEDDEEEHLWKSLCQSNDPYHPLNFRAHLQSSPATTQSPPARDPNPHAATPARVTPTKPALPERRIKRHTHRDQTLRPWRRPARPSETAPRETKRHQAGGDQRKVSFSPLVQVHVMRSWPFARQASRKGQWEEMARDRDRFKRRIQEAERSVGPCLSPAHRDRTRARPHAAICQH